MHAQSKNMKLHTKVLAISALTGVKEEHEEFCIFDKDGNGHICEVELRNALWKLDFNPSEAEIIKMINEAEVDGDGTLSRSELVKWVEQLEDFGDNINIQDSIRAFDNNKNAFVSVAELKGNKNGSDKQKINTSSENIDNANQESINQCLSINQSINQSCFTGNPNTNVHQFEAFVTVLMQSKPSNRKGCKRQTYSSEGGSEMEIWRKRWRRNAAMRSASVIFPKTWWMLIAKIDLQRNNKGDNIDLKLTVYYWLKD